MNWSRVKTFLIIIFLIINSFLITRLIEKNSNYIDKNAANTVIQILKDRNIQLLGQIPEVKRSYRRILIRNEDNKTQNSTDSVLFASLNDIKSPNVKINNTSIIFESYIGKSRNIMQWYDVLVEFIRKMSVKDTKISNIRLGYFIDFDKYQSSLKTAEINPSWQIELADGKKYVFDAYNAELLYEGK